MKSKLRIFILSILLSLLGYSILAKKAHAADLGICGESAPIAEEDFETHIVKQLEALGEDKLKNHQEMIKDKMVTNIKRPKAVAAISKASVNTNRFYDPTFTLNEDIYNDKQQLLYAAGTSINPLEKKSFEEIWIFIDGDDNAQVEFASNYQAESQNNKIKKIILVNGAPGAQEDGSFFFFDQAGSISKKLNITKVPSVVRQAPDRPKILIEEIALDNEEAK